MKQFYQIHELAKLFDLCPDTLRYYEEKGLLHPVRGEKRYRMYGIQDVCTLNIIRALRELKIPTRAIRTDLERRSVGETLSLLDREEALLRRRMAELEAAVDLALQHDSRVVFERFVQGQEVECAVRGNDEVSGTHPGEILASAEFYTYDDKYISGTSRVAIPAQLAPEKLDEVRDLAVRAYRARCCKGLARVDFFVEHGTQRVLLNEINTLPGFTSISMYPKLMLAAGETYPGLLDSLITLALERAGGVHD